MEKELYLCKVHSNYIKYLHSIDNRVSVKYNNRPYVGLITMINGIKYVLPLTSQTTTERKKVVKESVLRLLQLLSEILTVKKLQIFYIII